MSGSGGAGGYDYQANAFAYVVTHAVCQHPLGWFDDFDDTPTAVRSETNGPGDDFGIETRGGITIEVQAKHGLSRGQKFDETVQQIVEGLVRDPLLGGVFLVDSTASGPMPNEAADLEYEAITAGLGMLFQELPPEEADQVAELVATSDNHSVRTAEVAETYLKIHKQQAAINRIRDRNWRRWSFPLPEDIFPRKPSRAATEAFLDAVLMATNVGRSATHTRTDRPLLNLAAVHHAMHLMEVPIGDWYAIGHRDAEDILTE